jgi:FHA domain
MITCPNCSQLEMEGALFCKECGQLLFDDTVKTSDIKISSGFDLNHHGESIQKRKTPRSNPFPDARVTIYILGEDAFVPIELEEEVILGRSGEGQSMLPDVDLNKYRAFESGVSRFHAAMNADRDQVIITDLGSLNGTSVNGVKIEPHVSYPLRDGDIVCLGRFKFEVLTQK